MKTAFLALLLALLLLGCTQTLPIRQTHVYIGATPTTSPETSSILIPTAVANASLQPPSSTPTPPKLDSQALSRYILQFTDAPHWVSWCQTSCNGLRYVIQDAACAPARPDEYLNPLFSIVNASVLSQMPNASKEDVTDACMRIVPDVLIDCDAFDQGTLSCGRGLSGCQDGGFFLQFNRTRLLNATDWESDTQVFIDTHAFKKLLDKDDCYKPPLTYPRPTS